MSVSDTLLSLMDCPTVQMLFAETATTSYRALRCDPTFGLGTMLHRVPFQCSIRVRCMLLLLVEVPTVQPSPVETVVTLLRKLSCDPTFGLGTMLHRVPFQCSISVWNTPLLPTEAPTVQISFAETALASIRELKFDPGLGLGTTLHCVPFQCRINVEPPELLIPNPTAQTLFVETATVPSRKLSWLPAFGLETMLHWEPSQCWISPLEVWVPGIVKLPVAQTSLVETAESAVT